jgi:two-component system, chemotaxis family, chemotaxis protein CheY
MTAKVLVVDDSALARRRMREILEGEGHQVVEADEGMAAIERYFLERPDLVLLDLVMKGMYGLDVLAKIREIDPAARVIVISADVQDSSRELAVSGGAGHFITKPPDREELLAAVNEALAGARS